MNLLKQMGEKGVKLRTWAKAKNLSDSDIVILYDMNYKKIKGVRGRAQELKKILNSDGWKI